ncbi:MAG: hypothetical protein HY719_09685, partial [Planctomycetes bacterium]|nr:hypothetical protein [Planctomycetota bacterium]
MPAPVSLFPVVIGHDDVKERFARILHAGRVAHGYLFLGSAGIGKALFARELFKAILCAAPREDGGGACGACPACHKIDHDNHADARRFAPPEGKRLFPMEEVRRLQEFLALKSLEGGAKCALVEAADLMSPVAANALLKTLEEPPPRTHLVLLAEEARRLLPTMISRCHIVRFAPLAAGEVAGVLDALARRRAPASGPPPSRLEEPPEEAEPEEGAGAAPADLSQLEPEERAWLAA